MTIIVLATRNQHKLVELERIVASAGLDVELKSVADFPGAPEVEETADTFEGNALLKARALAEFTGHSAIADDSGICVDALDGKPGIYSARWSGATGDVDRANLELVLDQTKDVSDDLRGAQFVCAAAYVGADGREFTTRGTVSGMLLRAPRGTNGFGYDPIFLPDGFQITTAQMTAEQKDSISHRSKALAQLVQLITS
ncbi:MAG: RdgB/HAM1 family non-canonical purine NTP pyrophosphatase [Actinomycetes bacterium]